jgi:CDP-archaeol synthase
MSAFRILQVFWFMLPVVIAGLIHVAVIKLGWLAALARYPLDQRLTVKGRRLLGDNKTVRGALVMTGATAIVTFLLARIPGSLPSRLAVDPAQVTRPAIWGLLLGAGYILGELPNSLIKRQIGIAPGAAAAGRLKMFGWIVDQIDSVVGAFLALAVIWRPDPAFIALVIAVTLVLHPSVAALMVALNLKERIG